MSGVNGCDKHPDRIIDCCVECLKLAHADCLETIRAVLFAARGGECDLATLEREMNAVSTKPSEYIRHIVSSKDRQLADALKMLSDLKFLQESTVLANAALKSQIAQARAEIERLRKLQQFATAINCAMLEADCDPEYLRGHECIAKHKLLSMFDLWRKKVKPRLPGFIDDEISKRDALIEQMRGALKAVVSSAPPGGPLWHGSAEIVKAVAAIKAAERGE